MRPTDKFIFPLIGYELFEDEKKFKINQIVGTSFSIGINVFMTANHVLDQLKEYKKYGIFKWIDEGGAEIFEIDEMEKIGKTDVALFNVPKFNNKDAGSLIWDGTYSRMFSDVMAIGFPFGFKPDKHQVHTRGYKGYVISATHIEEYEGVYYELSFSCPRGISGAPLLDWDDGTLKGVIIGNKSTEIEVYRDKEVIGDGTKTKTYIRYEAVEYGLALDIDCIRSIPCKLLHNHSLEEYFKAVLDNKEVGNLGI